MDDYKKFFGVFQLTRWFKVPNFDNKQILLFKLKLTGNKNCVRAACMVCSWFIEEWIDDGE